MGKYYCKIINSWDKEFSGYFEDVAINCHLFFSMRDRAFNGGAACWFVDFSETARKHENQGWWFLWNRKEIAMKIEKNIFNINISIQMPLFITEDKKNDFFWNTLYSASWILSTHS